MPTYDTVVIGSGPNGLAAAITMAQAGRAVVVFEAKETIGGGTRTKELTLPGFAHDVCAAIHPLGVGTPFIPSLPLQNFGLEWVYPRAALAHPLDDGTAAILENSILATGETLGTDGRAYAKLMLPLVDEWANIAETILAPIRLPHHPIALARFGLHGIRSAHAMAENLFKGPHAQAMVAGLGAHSMLPLTKSPSAAFSLVLGVLGHAVGWPMVRGGSQRLTEAMAGYFRSLGGEIVTGMEITSLPEARTIFCDTSPKQLMAIAGDRLSPGYKRALRRFRYGPGVFKVDYALDGPIPWLAEDCARAGTVHLGGTLAEITAAEKEVADGKNPEKPFVLMAQQSLFDPTRAPAGKHTAWAYCHVPNDSTFDMTARIEAQIERFAPGFRDRVLARHTMNTADYENYNPNYIGGDINGGIQDIWQLFTRPVAKPVPYATGVKGLYLCSSSTPPGGGVHGLCGFFAAQAALHAKE